jgi:hypothetical protein
VLTPSRGVEHFGGRILPLPVIIGLTAYGRCLGLTRGLEDWLAAPRITLARELFNGNHRTVGGQRMIADVIAHELVYVALMLRPPGSKNRRPAPHHDLGKTTKRERTLKAQGERAG